MHTYVFQVHGKKYKRSVKEVICIKTFSDTGYISDVCKKTLLFHTLSISSKSANYYTPTFKTAYNN